MNHPNPSNLPLSSQHLSTNQSNSSSSVSNPRMAQPQNRMAALVATRYAPIVFPQPLISLTGGDYQDYVLRFYGQGDVTAEEHWNTYLSYADNQNFENEDVWMRVFVQSLDGEVRKWFRELPPNSIDGIDALEEVFMRQWGDTKDYLYYITEFGSLKRKK